MAMILCRWLGSSVGVWWVGVNAAVLTPLYPAPSCQNRREPGAEKKAIITTFVASGFGVELNEAIPVKGVARVDKLPWMFQSRFHQLQREKPSSLPVEQFSANGEQCLNCLCQLRGQAQIVFSSRRPLS